jgi:sporulation protein YlmC with PRC-barrel domain
VGRLGDVIVEPQERRVTHLVVAEPEGRARLVPAQLLRPKRTRNLTLLLSCSTADFLACESIRSFAFVGIDGFPKHDEHYDIGVEETIVVPSFGASEFGSDAADPEEGYGVTYDRIPTGSAELRRTSPILSSEGDGVGHVDGFLVDGDRLTHVVLQSGHGLRPQPVAIPVEAVESIETDCITLTMPKDTVASFRGGRSSWLPFG